MIRGLRAVADFEYEFQSNRKRLHGELETAFLMAAEQQHFVASRFVKEVARFGGDVSSLCQQMWPKIDNKTAKILVCIGHDHQI